MYLSVEKIREIIKDKIPSGLVVAEHTESGHFYRHVPTNSLFSSVTTKCGILEQKHLKVWSANLAVEHIKNNLQLMLSSSDAMEKVCKQAVIVHQDRFEDAGDTGTRGHKIIEDYLIDWMNKGVRPESIKTFIPNDIVDSRIVAIARSAEMFCKDFNVIPIVSEMKIASVKYKYGGTLDSLMMVLKTTQKGSGDCLKHDFLQMSTSNPNKVKCLYCGLTGEHEFSVVDWKTSNSIDKVEYAMQTAAYWQAIYEMTGLKPKKIYVVRLDKTQAKYEVRVLTNRANAFKAFKNASKIYDWLHDGTEKLVNAFPREIVTLDSLLTNKQ